MTGSTAFTGFVKILNVAEVCPVATVTLGCTIAAILLSPDRITTAPGAGAGKFNVTRPVVLVPPVTIGVVIVTDASAKEELMVSEAECVPLRFPEIVADVSAATRLVVTVNVAVVAPANTVTLAGTVAVALSLDSVTMAPADGAAAFKVTVPVEETPPVTLVGFTATESNAGGLMVSEAVWVPL